MAEAKCIALLLLAMAVGGAQGLDFVVINSAEGSNGGKRFDKVIGRSDAQQIMYAASQFIWQIFAEQASTDRKNVQTVTLFVEVFVESMSGVAAYTTNDEIHLSAEYVANYEGDVKNEIKGVLYREMTHVWQWNDNDAAPSGLIEGIADYVRLTAGLAPSGSGDRWEQGYDVTAYFLQYCDTVASGFVAKMNSKLRDGWEVGFFNDVTGKSVHELWNDYKAKYANSSFGID